MGRRVAEIVGARLGRTLLELGGNNAVLVMDDADLNSRSARSRSARPAPRPALHDDATTRRARKGARRARDEARAGLRSMKIGDPLQSGTLMGPLIHQGAVDGMLAALERAKKKRKVLTAAGASTRRASSSSRRSSKRTPA